MLPHRVWHLCAYTLFRLNSIARYVLSSLEEQSLKYSVNLLLTYINILWCWAWLFDKNCLHVQYFFSYHGYHISFRLILSETAVHSFTSRKLFICLEMFLHFLHQFDPVLVSRAFCLVFIPPLFALTPHESNVAAFYVQVCWKICCTFHWLCSGKTMVLILHVDLISCRYFRYRRL